MITRLGLYGGPRPLYGSFSGKQPFVPVECTLPTIGVLSDADIDVYAFMSAQDVITQGALSDADIVTIGALSDTFATYGFMSDGDIVTQGNLCG